METYLVDYLDTHFEVKVDIMSLDSALTTIVYIMFAILSIILRFCFSDALDRHIGFGNEYVTYIVMWIIALISFMIFLKMYDMCIEEIDKE